jgi:uncharacterized protein (DUF433 family)
MNEDRSHHLRLNDRGILCVGDAGIPLDDFMHAYASCRDFKEIQQFYPELSEVEIRAAISYGLYNPDEATNVVPEPGAYWKSHEL